MAGTLIHNGTLVNEGCRCPGWIWMENERIVRLGEGSYREGEGLPRFSDFGRVVDARGGLVLPGVIDDQVHFREPGLTHKGDIAEGAAAAVAGGVTSFMEMPNTRPPATTRGLVEEKFGTAERVSPANYSFYIGATNDNAAEIARIDPKRVCGIKVFMGSSTGNMLVDDDLALSRIFAEAPTLVATHCEQEEIVRRNLEDFRARYGAEGVTPAMHPLIRSEEACYVSSARAVELAARYGTDLHVLHVSTGRELSLFESRPLAEKHITAEVCVHHLWFSDRDYARLGNRIKWNPAVKTEADREALRRGLLSGRLDVVATDHAPHTLTEKSGTDYFATPSGGPLVQHSLPVMLELARRGVLTVEQVVEKMAHAPAVRYKVRDRGFLRPGYYADVAVVDPESPWTVSRENILYRCGWSPLEGETFSARVTHTFVNGAPAYENGRVNPAVRGRALEFDR